MLLQVGRHLGSLANKDLAERCAAGPGNKHLGRAERKKALTGESSSRWAGSITRDSADKWERALKNLYDERSHLRAAVRTITNRLAAPVGDKSGRVRGYATQNERFQKQRRLQHLQARLGSVEDRIKQRRVSVCRGGQAAARARHNLEAAGLSEDEWAEQWRVSRLFLSADGDAVYPFGNGSMAVDPSTGAAQITLPSPLKYLSNTPGSRPLFELSSPVLFGYRQEEWVEQATTGALKYDLWYDPGKRRWYMDASWKITSDEVPELEDLMDAPVLSVDLNGDHLACHVVAPDGNPCGLPQRVTIELDGSTQRRLGQLRHVVKTLLDIAVQAGCKAIVIEDLNFLDARQTGKETMGRGGRGKRFRRTVAGIPTAKFREALRGMAYRRGIAVVAVDPAYTSKWGKVYWLEYLKESRGGSYSVHDAAAVVIGRRCFGHKPKRRRLLRPKCGGEGVTRPHQRMGDGELPNLFGDVVGHSDLSQRDTLTAATRRGGGSALCCEPEPETGMRELHREREQGMEPSACPAASNGALVALSKRY